MTEPSVAIPIEHISAICEVEMNPTEQTRAVTLLELVEAVSEVSETEQEVLATVFHMLSSGRVRLSGNFRDTPIAKLCG